MKDLIENLKDDARKIRTLPQRVYSFFRYKDIKMCVLGDKSTGKTCLYSFYKEQKKPFSKREYTIPPKATSLSEVVPELTLLSTNGIKLTVEEGTDISGAPEKVCVYYRDKVNENELVIYLFNSSEFSNNKKNRKYVVAQIYLISIFIKEKEREQKERIEKLKSKQKLSSEENKELKKLEYNKKSGTTFLIVPTWKSKCDSINDKKLREMLDEELQKSEFLYKAIENNNNVKICKMFEFVHHKEHGEQVLDKESLKELTDEVIKIHTGNLKRNHKWKL